MNDGFDKNKNDWVSVQHLQHLVARVEAVGLDVNELLALTQINVKQLENAEATIPLNAIEYLIETMVERFPDVPLGLQMASGTQAASFGVLGYLSHASANFAEALQVLEKYNGLLSNIGEISLSNKPGFVCVEWSCKSVNPLFHRHATEYILASLVMLARGVLPSQKSIIHAVYFPHAVPKNITVLSQYHRFFQCPVYFNADSAQIIIASKLMKASLRYSDASMKKTLAQHADALLNKRLASRSVSDDVKDLIIAMLGEHLPSKEMIAQQLGFSGRSLHRKLEQEATSFQTLLDEVRLALANKELLESESSLDRIASDLSFQSRQSFIRWYKNQTQITPGEFRQNKI